MSGNGKDSNSIELLKTASMENRIDKFVKSIDDVESLAEAETVGAIQELLEMGTIKNWGALVKIVLSEMKDNLKGRIERANDARQVVNR